MAKHVVFAAFLVETDRPISKELTQDFATFLALKTNVVEDADDYTVKDVTVYESILDMQKDAPGYGIAEITPPDPPCGKGEQIYEVLWTSLSDVSGSEKVAASSPEEAFEKADHHNVKNWYETGDYVRDIRVYGILDQNGELVFEPDRTKMP